jgi:hypothetical protein
MAFANVIQAGISKTEVPLFSVGLVGIVFIFDGDH